MGKMNIITEWANTGEKIAPSSAKVAEGWLPNEEPACEWENYEQSKKDRKINEIIEELNFRDNESPTKSVVENFADYDNDNDFHHMYSAKNIYALDNPATAYCKGYNYAQKQYCLFIACHNEDDKIYEIYNNRTTGEIGSISHDIVLPAGEEITALVYDGDYLYIGTTDASPKSSVYKFATNPWNGSGTPEDSCAFAATLCISGPKSMCLASATKLGVIFPGGLAANRLATVTVSTMTIDGYGNGNAVLTANVEVTSPGIASDGTNLYFAIHQTAGDKNHLFCAAKISNRGVPTATGLAAPIAITSSEFPANYLAPSGLKLPAGIIVDGSTVWLLLSGRSGGSVGLLGLFVYDIDGDIFYSAADPIFKNELCTHNTDDNPATQLTFDGKRFWLQAYDYGTGLDSSRFVAPFVPELAPVKRIFDMPNRYHVGSFNEETVISNFICYADDCIWFSAGESEIRRLPAISRLY